MSLIIGYIINECFMSHDAINSWIEKAKHAGKTIKSAASDQPGIQVIRAPAPNAGQIIVDLSERIFPWLMKMFDGARDENGMAVQPAHIRGIALNVAQGIVKEQEKKSA